MFILENLIADIPMNTDLEVDLITCFANDDLILFKTVDMNKEDLKIHEKHLEEMKMQFGKYLRCSEEDEEPTIYDIKQPINSYFKECQGMSGVGLREVSWYSLDTIEELRNYIEYHTITYEIYINSRDKIPGDYKFKLYMYEHIEIDDNEYRGFFIEERGNNTFSQEVLPKINKLLENITNI